MNAKPNALEAKFFVVGSGINWNECPLSKIINDIVSGHNKASDAIDYVRKTANQANALSKSMADPDQWVHGTDDNGNEAYYCQSGENNATLSVLDLPQEYIGTIRADYRFAKYVVLNQNIAGYSSNHGFVWYATMATEVITEIIFSGFVLSRMRDFFRLANQLLRGNNIAEFIPRLNAEIGAELDVIPEAPAALEVDAVAMEELFGLVGVAGSAIALAVIAALVYTVFEFFVIRDYNSMVLYINLSQKTFQFSSAYLDNVDPDHLPASLNPASTCNSLPAFQRFSKYDPTVGFKPDEPYAQMVFLSFVNKHTVFEGLGTLLKFQDTKQSNTNFLSLYEVNRFENNRQGVELNYPRTDYKDYYDDNNHKHKSERIEQTSGDLRVIAQTNVLSGADKETYKTVVIILDADQS